MSEESDSMDDERGLEPGDAALVHRIAAAYRPPDAIAAARVEFRTRPDPRIRRRAARRVWVAGIATATAAVAFALLWATAPVVSTASPPDVATGDALLALAASSEEEALPADYQAIEDLLLEGEGV